MSVTNKRLTHSDRVFNFLKKQKQPVTAYEILDLLRSEGITAATTVYRALDKLHKDGLIHRIESLNAWTICCGSHKNKIPVFEICNDCGDVKEHLDQKLTDEAQQWADYLAVINNPEHSTVKDGKGELIFYAPTNYFKDASNLLIKASVFWVLSEDDMPMI